MKRPVVEMVSADNTEMEILSMDVYDLFTSFVYSHGEESVLVCAPCFGINIRNANEKEDLTQKYFVSIV